MNCVLDFGTAPERTLFPDDLKNLPPVTKPNFSKGRDNLKLFTSGSDSNGSAEEIPTL
jgi:hypothetical protein